MENANQFSLEVAMDGYLQQLQLKGNYTSEDILELKNHLADEVNELKKKDLNDDEALMIAKKRLGKEEELNQEYKKVNGISFYNRELFLLVLSICTYLFAYYFYSLATGTIKQYAVFQNQNVLIWGAINYIFIILFTIIVLYLVFNCKKYIRFVERLFVKSPVNFSLIFIALTALVYVFNLRIGKMLLSTNSLPSEEIRNRFFAFNIDDNLRAFVYWGLACVWIVSIAIAFIRSYKKINFMDAIVNRSGYIPLFLIGLFWDGMAASARMLNHHNNLSVYVFGLIWLTGMFIFNFHLRKEILIRNLIFVSFGFILELCAGIWMNPALKEGLPVSVYFIGVVIGASIGFAIATFIKKRNLEITAR